MSLQDYLKYTWAYRQFDSIPEFGMHLGGWLMFLGLGILYGVANPEPIATQRGIGLLAVGAVIGIAGQLAVELHNEP